MKKNDLNVNQNLFIKKIKSFQSKKLIQNPKKLFRKKTGGKDNFTSLYLNQTSPYYNNAKHKFYLKKGNNTNKDYQTEKASSPIRTTFTKLNQFRLKMNHIRPMSSSVRKLPAIFNSNNNNNCSLNFSPNSYICLEEEKLHHEKNQLNKLIKYLNKQLKELNKENEAKDVLLNNEEKELNDIIYKSNLTDEEKELNSIILNYQNEVNYVGENESVINKNNSSYILILKIRKEIKKFNEKILEETEKINFLKKSIIYTKLKEINVENDFIETQIKKISALLNNSLNIKESNDQKLKEIESFEHNIDIQNSLIEELEFKREMLNKEEKDLQNKIQNIENDNDLIKIQVIKNTKELDTLRKKNKNLLNDKIISSKIIINDENPNQSLKGYYTSKMSQLKKDIHFFRLKNNHDENIMAKLKEQKTQLIESRNQQQKKNNYLNKAEVIKEENNEEDIIPEQIELDEEKIEKLKKIYMTTKNNERILENKYNELIEKFRALFDSYQDQNNKQEVNVNLEENKQDENIIKDNNNNIAQKELEFGINANNPFYTEEENNNPETDLKFNSTQYNQFTYILFKNFESKGIISDESYNKIISPFVEFANEKKLKMVKYPSEQFDIIVEGFTSIILDVINSNNKYNHSLTKIFLSALLINSECDIQKMIEYFAILFSYTKDYKTDEEKYLTKLKNLFTKEVNEINIAIIKYIEKAKKEKQKYEDYLENYFPLIKLKELIEENKINLKDKYIEFLFYYLKQFDDKNAKLDYLKYSKLNDLLEDDININPDFSLSEEEKKLNTEPTKQKDFDNILKPFNKDNNIDNANNDEISKDANNEQNKLDDSATEITIDEYMKQLKESLDLIKKVIKVKNISFNQIVEEKKKVMKNEEMDVEYISIDDLNKKLRSLGVNLSDLKLSCLCSKYSLQNDLRLINIKSLEKDLNLE